MKFILSILAICFVLAIATARAELLYPITYDGSRSTFQALSETQKKAHPTAEIGSYKVDSKSDQDLTTDYFYIPATSTADKLIIVTSGVHGVECFTGAALQFMLLEQVIPQMNFEHTGILLIHALNPYGFKYLRRVTESNVDLNRSLFLDRKNVKLSNPSYADFDSFLNPKEKLRTSLYDRTSHVVRTMLRLLFHSMGEFRQTILQGQYQYPNGLFYGGSENEPQETPFREVLLKYATPYRTILYVDLHTGYGKKGVLHFLAPKFADPKVAQAVAPLYQGFSIDNNSDKDFYDPMGETVDYVPEVLKDHLVIPMTFEFGTMDSQTTMGAMESLRRLIRENQGRHFGYSSQYDADVATREFLSMFNPEDKEWRLKVVNETLAVFTTLFSRLNAL